MILVTGATGFLGKRVCSRLDIMGLEYTKTSLSLGLDLRNKKETIDFFNNIKPEYVLNCAAFIGGVQFGYEHAAEMFTNNLEMEISLLSACKESGVKRLVNPIGNCSYPGEAEIYKENEFWDGPLHESVMAYGLAKKAFCVGAWAYNRQYGLDVINLVFSNMYGPEDHFQPEKSHAVGALIMKFVDAKENNHPSVIVWGTGSPIREWLHVDDGAEALIRGMSLSPYSDIINIGVSHGISIKETALLIKDIVGYTGELVFDTSKIDGAPCKQVDGTLSKTIMNWQPEIEFEDGLRQTIEWYLTNRKRGG